MKTTKLFSVILLAVLLCGLFVLVSCGKDKGCDHAFSEWTLTKKPSCIEAGVETRLCGICGHAETQFVAMSSHTEVIDFGVEATCTSNGITEGKHCAVCQAVLVAQQVIPMGHTEVIDAKVEPTCSATGLTEGKHCSICKEVLVAQQVIPTKEHTEVIDLEIESTCTATGLTEGKHCSICSKVLVAQQVIPTKEHTEVIDLEIESTCTATGLTEGKHCSICSKVLVAQQVIPTKEHTEEIDAKVESTCATTGLTEGTHCSVCKKVLVAQQIIPTKPHTEIIDQKVESTCTTEGLTEGKHCSACQAVLIPQTIIPTLDHIDETNDGICDDCDTKFYSVGLEYRMIDTQYYIVTGIGFCTDTDVFIPTTYNHLPVKGIATLGDWSTITSISIPNSVTFIEQYAFEYCSNLTSIKIHGTIDTTSFLNYCPNIKDVYVYDVQAWLNSQHNLYHTSPNFHILDRNGQEITELILPDSIINIPNYAFENFNSLVSITIPNSVTTIGSYAFKNCSNLVSIFISDNTSYIGEKAFYGCENLKYTEYKNGCYLGNSENPFFMLYKVKNTSVNSFTIHEKTQIVSGFNNCTNLTSILIPNNVTTIGETAFYGCTSLVDVIFSEGSQLQIIESGAFQRCSSLSNINFPSGITSLGLHVFDECSSLPLNEYDNAYYLGNNDNPYFALIEAKNKEISSCHIHENTEFICSNAFEECSQLTQIYIPEKVISIGFCAFYRCSALLEIRIPYSVISIGDLAFNGCESLVSIYIPNTVNVMGSFSFSGYSHLKSVHLPDNANITSINSRAFYGCESLVNVNIPNSVISIGDEAFSGCLSLASITIPSSVNFIGLSAFYKCEKLENVYISNIENWLNICHDNSINRYSVYSYPNYYGKLHILDSKGNEIEKITIPENTLTIPDYAFYNCSASQISIPKSTLYIGDYAFANCSNATWIILPSSSQLFSIGYGAFMNCVNLTDIALCNNLLYIGDYAFYGCSKLFSINIPKSLISIGDYAFHECKNISKVYVSDLENWLNINFGNTSSYPNSYGSGSTLYFLDADAYEIKELVVPNGITNIPNLAFYNSSATSIVIPDSVITIGAFAFAGENCNISTIVLGKNVASIGDYAFLRGMATWLDLDIYISNIEGWLNIQFGNEYSHPNNYYSSSRLHLLDNEGNEIAEYTIPKSITCIPDYAFKGCASLVSITIPNHITSIGNHIFENSVNLENIYIFNIEAWLNIQSEYDPSYELTHEANIYILDDNGNYVSELIIPEGISEIPGFAFYNCSYITSISIPGSVKSIGANAFYGCDNLKDIYISDIESWCNIRFYGYNSNPILYGNLHIIDNEGKETTELIIPDKVASIPVNAFYNCSHITSVSIPDSVTSIGSGAFEGCSALASVVFGQQSQLQSIGANAFYQCKNLTSIAIPDSVTNIGSAAFWGCDNFKDVYYLGSKLEWSQINIESRNDELTDATIHFNYVPEE